MKLLFTLLFLVTSFTSWSQQQTQQEELKIEADKYFKEEQYNLAIQYYRELANLSDQNSEINYQMAESYRKTFNYAEAETYYLKVHYQAPTVFPLALYYYSLMLKLNGAFDESIYKFSEFILANSDNKVLNEFVEQAAVERAGSEMAKIESAKQQISYPLQMESLNSAYNDYAPTIRDSITLVITSGRIASNREVIDERYGEAFTDNLYFSKTGNVWHDKTRQIFNVTNSKYNDGSGSFNRQGDQYYYTLCGKDGPHCRIFLTELKNNKWTTPVPLGETINVKNYETKHPAISHGGDTLLFASNRPGGFGNSDIWMSIRVSNTEWGPAMNLGGSVNTKLNELAPAVTKYPNVFFFASDGHQNYGGLDLYMVKRLSSGQISIFNLDYPFNSNRDDCFITLDESKIYFSSNRSGGIGNFDIYSATIPSVISFISKLSLKNKDARSDVKLNSRTDRINNMNLLTARNEDRIEYENLTYPKKKIVDKMTNNQINHTNDLPSEYGELTPQEYDELKVIAELRYKTRELEKRLTKTILKSINTPSSASQHVSITATLIDSASGNFLANKKILLMDDLGEVIKVTTTNRSGKFRFTNIASSRQLFLRLEEIPSTHEDSFLLTNFKLTDDEAQTNFGVENIYFDFDHYNLRPEGKQVLNDLVIFLKSSPFVQVEIYAYADDLGADDYNLALTEKRGQAVLNYLTENGVDQTSLAVVAKGKQKISSLNVEVQRQFNRRVEFYLNGSKSGFDQNVKTYILRKKTDWDTIAASTGINKEELKHLNGSTANDLQIFQPIRIPTIAKGVSPELFFELH
ncbi:hypothetical protein BH10BAC4_BH10BAC4_09160 [soil metagenome]